MKNHEQPKGTIGSLEKALDRYGVPVSEIEEHEAINGLGSGGTMADPKNMKMKTKMATRPSDIMPSMIQTPAMQVAKSQGSSTPTPPPAPAQGSLLVPKVPGRTPSGGFVQEDIVYSDEEEDERPEAEGLKMDVEPQGSRSVSKELQSVYEEDLKRMKPSVEAKMSNELDNKIEAPAATLVPEPPKVTEALKELDPMPVSINDKEFPEFEMTDAEIKVDGIDGIDGRNAIDGINPKPAGVETEPRPATPPPATTEGPSRSTSPPQTVKGDGESTTSYNQAQSELQGNSNASKSNLSGDSDNEDSIVVNKRQPSPPKRTRHGRFVKKPSISSKSPGQRHPRKGSDF